MIGVRSDKWPNRYPTGDERFELLTDIQQLRLGVHSCGTHGTNLALAVARSAALRLVACADPDTSAAQRAASASNCARTYEPIESMLEVDESLIDVVLVATPQDELARTALTAIRAGKLRHD